jgi:VWFA-related protein
MTRTLAALGLMILGPILLAARPRQQSAAAPPPPQQPAPALTLHAASRIVLADIIVTDRHGIPVHGLSAADFQVFDNGRPQRIASFDENDGTAQTTETPSAAPANVASNNFQHLPPVVNVILLDTTNLELPDQMYLRIQLTRFLKALPAGQPLAVFERHGDNTVLMQGFTSDHALLQAAIDRALPRIVLTGREYRSDTDTLLQMSAYLGQVPGRKNVLWFSGGSTAFLLYGLSALTASSTAGPPPSSAGAAAAATVSTPLNAPTVGEDNDALRQAYDSLEAARIAIYPIDARGLTTSGDVALGPEQSQMTATAEATGGQAIFNNNGLAEAAAHLVSADSTTYTLTYSPQDFHYDGKWHNLRITVRNRDLRLSYRRGYFADQPDIAPRPALRNTLLAGDSTPVAAPDIRSSPLLFEASAHPGADSSAAAGFIQLQSAAAAGKGATPFRIDYSLSTAGLSPAPIDGASRATVIFAAIALNSNGARVGQALDRVRFPLDPSGPPHRLQVEQQIDLPKGGDVLALAVWDPVSGHVGTLQIPITVGAKN